MEDNIIGQKEVQVLEYLKKKQNEINGKNIIASYYGVGAKDIIKYIERPEACGKWPFDFVCLTQRAVNLIAKNYINNLHIDNTLKKIM